MRPELTPADDPDFAALPEAIRKSIHFTEQSRIDLYDYYTLHCGPRERTEAGYVIHRDDQGHQVGGGPAWQHFGLSYASWLVLPRVGLQEMPLDWQARFFALIDEATEKHGLPIPEGLYVTRRIAGKYVNNDHWNDYRHGCTAKAKATDKEKGYTDDRD